MTIAYRVLPNRFLRLQSPQTRIHFRGLAAAGRLWYQPDLELLDTARTSPGAGWVQVTVAGARAGRE